MTTIALKQFHHRADMVSTYGVARAESLPVEPIELADIDDDLDELFMSPLVAIAASAVCVAVSVAALAVVVL